MKKIGWLLCVLLASVSGVFAQQKIKKAEKAADAETAQWHYELECAGEGKQGTYIVKVWSYSKRADVAIDQAKKNAVHGIVFKGYASMGQTCRGQKALASTPGIEDEHKEFFKKFFADGGDYMKYVQLSGEASKNTLGQQGDVIKLSGMKGYTDGTGAQYKVGVIVVVMKDELRKHLEQAGVIRGLSSGF